MNETLHAILSLNKRIERLERGAREAIDHLQNGERTLAELTLREALKTRDGVVRRRE